MKTFRAWLKTQEGKNTWIGDLAGDVRADEDSRSIGNTYSSWKNYLYSCNACDNALKALKQAWQEYKNDK